MKLNRIGLEEEGTSNLVDRLNDLLANYQIFYQNVRGFHWNITGEKFFELHLKFEELYNDLILKIDEVAERILTLAGRPDHAYSVYITKSEVKELRDVSDGKEAVTAILDAFKILLSKQRKLLELSGELGDEGTNALMSDYIRLQEKLVWMYSAFLGR